MISKWTTEHLKAVLDDPYTRGKNGHDYGPIKHELQREYEKRLEAIEEKPKKPKSQKQNKPKDAWLVVWFQKRSLA